MQDLANTNQIKWKQTGKIIFKEGPFIFQWKWKGGGWDDRNGDWLGKPFFSTWNHKINE